MIKDNLTLVTYRVLVGFDLRFDLRTMEGNRFSWLMTPFTGCFLAGRNISKLKKQEENFVQSKNSVMEKLQKIADCNKNKQMSWRFRWGPTFTSPVFLLLLLFQQTQSCFSLRLHVVWLEHHVCCSSYAAVLQEKTLCNEISRICSCHCGSDRSYSRSEEQKIFRSWFVPFFGKCCVVLNRPFSYWKAHKRHQPCGERALITAWLRIFPEFDDLQLRFKAGREADSVHGWWMWRQKPPAARRPHRHTSEMTPALFSRWW